MLPVLLRMQSWPAGRLPRRLVAEVTGVEAGQVQFAVDQMIQRGLVSMGL